MALDPARELLHAGVLVAERHDDDHALTQRALAAGGATFALLAVFVALEWRPGAAVVPAPGGRLHGDATVFLVLLAASFAAYLVGLALVRGAALAPVLALACAIQLVPLAGPLFLSSDGPAWTFRALAAACVLAATWLLARRRAFSAALLGWNPVVAVQFAGGGHNDALIVALVAVALTLGERGRVQAAGVAWAGAVLVKWVPILLLPLRGLEAHARGRRVGHLGFAVTVVAALAAAAILWRLHRLHAIVPVARGAARETSYAIPHRLHVPAWPFVLAYGIAYLWLLREAARGRARLALAFAFLLLALPYLAAWYVLWPVALAAWDDDDPATVLSLALCAYLLPQRLL